jgi:hypothetical protein
MHVRRAKGGQEATHPILGDELPGLDTLRIQGLPSDRQGDRTVRPVHLMLERAIKHQPRLRLTIRQRTRVIDR